MAIDISSINTFIKPAVIALGYELWGVEFLPGKKHAVLRIYIDSESGITIDDCAIATRQISAILDVEESFTLQNYTLEVSSPGLDRPLFTLDQYKRYIGSIIHITLQVPKLGRRHFKGTIQQINGDIIELNVDNEIFSIAFNEIKKARLEPKF